MTKTRTLSYREAIREALREAMQRDDRVFLMGGRCRSLWRGLCVFQGLA